MSKIPHSSNKSIHDALRVLAREIESEDGAANVAIAEAADRISELGTESEQLRRENAALKKQLTDTTDQFFSVSSENAALRAELAPLRETVGVAATASTCADDLSNWSKLVERADNSTRLERENAALRADKARLVELLQRWDNVVFDAHLEAREVGYSEYNITVGLICDTRAAIDAARKEARP